MTKNHVNPLDLINRPKTKIEVTASSQLIAAHEVAPRSPVSGHAMKLVEGHFEGKVFQMWCDDSNRITIPVKEG